VAWYRTGYWRRRGIPGPKPVLFFGNLNQIGNIVTDPLPFTLAKWTRKYGRVYGLQRGALNQLVISDPALANELLQTKFEVFHERDVGFLRGSLDLLGEAWD
jgi:hypothetical protein